MYAWLFHGLLHTMLSLMGSFDPRDVIMTFCFGIHYIFDIVTLNKDNVFCLSIMEGVLVSILWWLIIQKTGCLTVS